MLIVASSYAPTPTTLTLINGTVNTGYSLLGLADFGNSVWKHAYTGARGTQGMRPAFGVPDNRPLILPLRVNGTSKSNLASLMSSLYTVADEQRRFGGKVKWQSNNETYSQYYEVLEGEAAVASPQSIYGAGWGNRAETLFRALVVYQAQCAPYLLGDPMDISDPFTANTLANYTFDNGASGNLSITTSLGVTGNFSTEERLIHTAIGYTYGDHQVTVKGVVGTTLSGYKCGTVIKRIDASNYLECYVSDNGASSLNIDKIVAGVRTNLVTLALTRITNGLNFWIRGRIEGNTVFAEYFTAAPTPMGAPTATTLVQLTTADQATFGSAVTGAAGLSWIPMQVAATIVSLTVEPFTYRNRALPAYLALNGSVPGDASALANATITPSGGGPSAYATAVLGRSSLVSYWRLDEASGTLAADQTGRNPGTYVASPTLGVVGATTGDSDTAITLNGTTQWMTAADSTSLRLAAPFTVEAWVKPTDRLAYYMVITKNTDYEFRLATTTGKVELYVNNVLQVTSAAAVATGAWSHIVATHDGATAKVYINGVLDTSTAASTAVPTSSNVLSVGSRATGFPFKGSIDDPAVYSRVLTAAEIAGNYAAATVTDTTVAPVFAFLGWSKRPAVGLANAPFAIIEAETGTTLATWAVAADGKAHGGSKLVFNTSGAGTASANFTLDPSLVIPDDYTQKEVDIEIWARVELATGVVTPNLTASVIPTAGVNFGTQKYTNEYGSAGKLLTSPSSSTVFRFVRLGTITMVADPSNPLIWQLTIAAAWGSASTGNFGLDYLLLTPIRARACSPTSKANDANYPKFVASTSETSRTIRSDLSGATAQPPANTYPDQGLGGNLLELPTGNVDCVVKLSSLVPDCPTSDATTEQQQHSGTVHLAVTPRFYLLRT